LGGDVLELKRRSYPGSRWYRSASRTKFDPTRYVREEKRQVFATYSVHVNFPQSELTTGEARKAPSTTPEYARTIHTLIELLELPGGWNSYSAKPIRKENVTFAVDLLARLMHEGTPAPTVVPKVRGGVQLEWHTKGVNLEIAIESPDDVTFFAEDIESNEAPEQELDESTVTQWIERISK
jgi:hypothetical protein